MGRKVRNAQLNTESARQDDCVCEREQLPNSRKGYSITHYIVDTISLRQTDRRRQEEDCIHHHQWCCLLIGSRCWMGPNKKKTTTGHYENDSFSTGIHTHTRKTLPRYTHTRTRHIFFLKFVCKFWYLKGWDREKKGVHKTTNCKEKTNEWKNKKQNFYFFLKLSVWCVVVFVVWL